MLILAAQLQIELSSSNCVCIAVDICALSCSPTQVLQPIQHQIQPYILSYIWDIKRSNRFQLMIQQKSQHWHQPLETCTNLNSTCFDAHCYEYLCIFVYIADIFNCDSHYKSQMSTIFYCIIINTNITNTKRTTQNKNIIN